MGFRLFQVPFYGLMGTKEGAQKRLNYMNSLLCYLEAGDGIEPTYTALQAAA